MVKEEHDKRGKRSKSDIIKEMITQRYTRPKRDMLKDNILQILDLNKEIIKDAFSIDENGINSIRKLLEKDRESFKQIVDDIFLSDIGNREKMVASYMIGHVNGARTRKMRD